MCSHTTRRGDESPRFPCTSRPPAPSWTRCSSTAPACPTIPRPDASSVRPRSHRLRFFTWKVPRSTRLISLQQTDHPRWRGTFRHDGARARTQPEYPRLAKPRILGVELMATLRASRARRCPAWTIAALGLDRIAQDCCWRPQHARRQRATPKSQGPVASPACRAYEHRVSPGGHDRREDRSAQRATHAVPQKSLVVQGARGSSGEQVEEHGVGGAGRSPSVVCTAGA